MKIVSEETSKQLNELKDFFGFESNEDLHEDLIEYIEEDGVFGKQLRHPLIYQVPFTSNKHANRLYLHKKEGVEKSLEEKNYERYIFLHERPYRVEAFNSVASNLTDSVYWKLLGYVWTDTENQWQNIELWKTLITSLRPSRNYLMTYEEDEEFRSLPDELIIYRGCKKGKSENGFSWTLNKEKAEWFAYRFDKEKIENIVLERKIKKVDAIALFLARGEQEIVYVP